MHSHLPMYCSQANQIPAHGFLICCVQSEVLIKLMAKSCRQVWVYTNITSPVELLVKFFRNLRGQIFIGFDFNIFGYLVTLQRMSYEQRNSSRGCGRQRGVWVDSSLVMTDSWH